MPKKIICIYAPGNGGTCNSDVCDHRRPHDENEFPEDGGCQWAKDPHCVPFFERKAVESILSIHFSVEDTVEITGLVLAALGIEEEEAA
jgi:hypothetical protein